MKDKIKDTTKAIVSKTKSAYHITKEVILNQDENQPQSRPIFSIEELYTKGKPIGQKESLVEALEECFEIEGNGGRIASAPEIVLMRNKGFDHIVWESPHDTFSSEHIGIDTQGLFTDPGKFVIVFAHNTGIPTIHALLNEKMESPLLEKGVRYDQSLFDQLLYGKTQDGVPIELFHIEELNETYRPTPYGFVMPITQEEMDKRKKMVFSKGINLVNPELSYFHSPIAKGRSGLDTDNIQAYVENCLTINDNKPFFFDYFDYNLPEDGKAEVRIINITGIGFQINNQNNPHHFFGIRKPDAEKEETE